MSCQFGWGPGAGLGLCVGVEENKVVRVVAYVQANRLWFHMNVCRFFSILDQDAKPVTIPDRLLN